MILFPLLLCFDFRCKVTAFFSPLQYYLSPRITNFLLRHIQSIYFQYDKEYLHHSYVSQKSHLNVT